MLPQFLKPSRLSLLCMCGLAVSAWAEDAGSSARKPIVVSEQAAELHRASLVIDGHNDLPWTLRELGGAFDIRDIAEHQTEMHTDIPRLRKGGVGAQFWSVFVPVDTMDTGSALSTTLEQIELVKRMIAHYPETFELALSTADIRRIHAEGKIASMIGVEGGHSIENSLNVLKQLYEQGARYMTLAHSRTLDWADSATDEARVGGLSAFGEEVVREMNQLGMLVDISHVSPACMKHTLRVTRAPVIFSHSSACGVADHPRNVPDDVLELTAKNGGVVMVNFFSAYVDPEAARRDLERNELRDRLMLEHPEDREAVRAELKRWDVKHSPIRSTVHVVLDHIDHIVKVAGINHVGLGSDYDGVSTLPLQLEDVSTYPVLTQGLLDRGYSPADVQKVLGENLMRVFAQAEQVARDGARAK